MVGKYNQRSISIDSEYNKWKLILNMLKEHITLIDERLMLLSKL